MSDGKQSRVKTDKEELDSSLNSDLHHRGDVSVFMSDLTVSARAAWKLMLSCFCRACVVEPAATASSAAQLSGPLSPAVH